MVTDGVFESRRNGGTGVDALMDMAIGACKAKVVFDSK